MKISDSCREVFNKVVDSEEGWENYLKVYDCEVTDENYTAMQKEVSDSILGILSNAAIAIAEQKKLLQSAKTPQALQSAVKLIAVTGGNLLHAGVGMLTWAGNTLTKRDSAPCEDMQLLLHDASAAGSPALLYDSVMEDYVVADGYSKEANSYSSCVRGIHDEATAIKIFADKVRCGAAPEVVVKC